MSRLRTLTVNRQRLTKPFTWLIIVLGGAALCHSLARLPLDRLDLRYLLLSLVTVAFGSRLIVKIPRVRGDITVSDTFVFLTLLLYGGEAAVLLATCEAFITTQRVTRTRPTQLFNTAMMTVSTYLTGLAVELNFAPLDALTRGEFNPRLIMMVCLMGLVQYATNAGLASVRSGFLTGRPLLDLWGKSFLWASITYFAGASAAALIARLAGTIGVYAFIFTTPIIATIYLTYRT
ncbi:MAG: hypothetical protein ACRD9R_14610, partial [Pyrinomonadaceae bacterium]